MADSWVYYNRTERIVRVDTAIRSFVQRFEGIQRLHPSQELVDDGIRVYEIPPGIFILRRSMRTTHDSSEVIRYDILGGNYSDDGRARRKLLEETLGNT